LFIKGLLPLTFLFIASARATQEPVTLSPAVRTCLAEAFRLSEKLGEKIWKVWNRLPFAVLLVTPETEYLIRHPKPSVDFRPLGYDPVLESEVFSRGRVFPPNLLATFPAVGGIPTIVVGSPEKTGKNPSEWVLTLLHEHFHQLQMGQPTYDVDVEKLGLTRGDTTGMWMLNFPFPYDSGEVKNRFSLLVASLSEALQAAKSKEFSAKLSTYLEARKRFQEVLAPDDYKYFSFQLWQEGIARYTETRIAQIAATDFKPSKEFESLPDFIPFTEVAASIRQIILTELPKLSLSDYRRVAFYYEGAGEGMLLDVVNGEWKERYLGEKFFLEKYFTN
jgi:hypothetical protein